MTSGILGKLVAIHDAEDFCSCAALEKSALERDYRVDCDDIVYAECHFEMCSVLIIYLALSLGAKFSSKVVYSKKGALCPEKHLVLVSGL